MDPSYLGFFSNFRWQDGIDIAISTFILVRFYMIFRGTNVVRVLIGIAILLFFGNLANFLGLIVTSWAIQGVTAAGVFIIIIIFRNEIRNVLEAQNLKAIFWGKPGNNAAKPLDDVAAAVFELARLRIGALIVIPGKETIRSKIQSGVPWRGLISKEALMSIFWRNNPVHDGAAILSGDQILEVRTILPLTRRTDLPSYYGTRHRAALGMAEATDALTIAVSEERGIVSVAKGGQLLPARTKKELLFMLREHVGTAKEEHYMRRRIMETGATALFSFLLVFAIWFNLVKGDTTLITVESPIKFVNNEQGMEIVKASANLARLQLSGSEQLMKSFRPDQIQVKLDLGRRPKGTSVIPLQKENVTMPPGIKLRRIEPAEIEVFLDKRVVKKVPVVVDFTGQLPDHLVLAPPSVEPKEVELFGLSQVMEGINEIRTQPVDRNLLNGAGHLLVEPQLLPAGVDFLPGTKRKFTLSYVIRNKNQPESPPQPVTPGS